MTWGSIGFVIAPGFFWEFSLVFMLNPLP